MIRTEFAMVRRTSDFAWFVDEDLPMEYACLITGASLVMRWKGRLKLEKSCVRHDHRMMTSER